MNQSEDKIHLIQQEIQQEREELTQEVQRLHRDNAIAQQHYQHIKQERDSFAHEKSVVEQLLVHANIEIATLTEKLAGLEQQNHERQERIHELYRQNQQTQANLEHYRNASLEQRLVDQQRYEQQQKQLEYTIQQLNHELTEVKQKVGLLHQENYQIISENDSLKSQFAKLEVQNESRTLQLTDTLSELAKKTQDQQHWHSQFQKVQEKYDIQSKSLTDTQTQYAALLQQIAIMQNDLNEVGEQNKVLAHEKWILGQEKAQLQGQLKQMEFSI